MNPRVRIQWTLKWGSNEPSSEDATNPQVRMQRTLKWGSNEPSSEDPMNPQVRIQWTLKWGSNEPSSKDPTNPQVKMQWTLKRGSNGPSSEDDSFNEECLSDELLLFRGEVFGELDEELDDHVPLFTLLLRSKVPQLSLQGHSLVSDLLRVLGVDYVVDGDIQEPAI